MVRSRKGKPATLWTSAAAKRLIALAGGGVEIRQAVELVANRFLEGHRCPPTNLDAIAEQLQVLRIEEEPMPISGELRREGNGFVIVCSSYLSPARRRFTIAHELAHCIFETTGPNCPRTGKELERLCDMLATELLMPGAVFRYESGRAQDLSWKKIHALSHSFGTSLSATSFRCAELLNVTIFEAEGPNITWGFGSIRKGPCAKLHGDILEALERIRKGESIDEEIFANAEIGNYQRWKVEGRMIGQDGRVMMLLIPMGR